MSISEAQKLQFIDLFTDALENVCKQVKELSDFGQIIKGLEYLLHTNLELFAEEKEKHLSAWGENFFTDKFEQVRQRLISLLEIVVNPDMYGCDDVDQFRCMWRSCISERIAAWQTWGAEQKQAYVERVQLNSTKRQTFESKIKDKKPPQEGAASHTISEEAQLQLEQARFNADINTANSLLLPFTLTFSDLTVAGMIAGTIPTVTVLEFLSQTGLQSSDDEENSSSADAEYTHQIILVPSPSLGGLPVEFTDVMTPPQWGMLSTERKELFKRKSVAVRALLKESNVPWQELTKPADSELEFIFKHYQFVQGLLAAKTGFSSIASALKQYPEQCELILQYPVGIQQLIGSGLFKFQDLAALNKDTLAVILTNLDKFFEFNELAEKPSDLEDWLQPQNRQTLEKILFNIPALKQLCESGCIELATLKELTEDEVDAVLKDNSTVQQAFTL